MGERMGLVPERISAGVNLDFRVTKTAYPAPDWAVSLILRGPAAIDVPAVAADRQHHFKVSAPVTSEWAPGVYWWVLRATRGDDVVQIDEGQLTVELDLAVAAAGFDGRSHAERVLRAIEAVIEGRASLDQQSYQINNRSLARTPIPDLLLLRDRYRAELRREKMAAQGKGLLGRQVKVRFC